MYALMKSRLACLLMAVLMVAAGAEALYAQEGPQVLTLEARAVLPAATFSEGPATGAGISSSFGYTVPFASPPVQGFSAVLPAGDGTWYVLSDNGFGSKYNSADYLLRFYEVRPDWDKGTVEVLGFRQLSDPNRVVPWPIVNNDTADRALTGADFDIESFRMTPDGTFWFGDEFGPYLLHTDAQGVLLEAPIPTPYPELLAEASRGLPFVQSPEHPDFAGLPDQDARRAAANLPSSRGFEGMALNTSGTHLYPLLEGAMVEAAQPTHLLLQEFELTSKAYTGRFWFYPLSGSSHAIGDMTAINDQEFLIIERDSEEGTEAAFKRVYQVNLGEVEEDGHTLRKTLVADLMAIYDAKGLTAAEEGAVGLGPVFRFPFVTIESVYPVDADTLLIINDNNFPFSSGRRPGLAPDDNEFILITLPQPLNLEQ